MNNKTLSFCSSSLLWLSALICFFIGLYIAIDHTHHLLLDFNYTLGPLQDEAFDAALRIYPVLNGEKSWKLLLAPFADHRVVVERLIFMYDFLINNGIEKAQPTRLLSVMGIIFSLFATMTLTIRNLEKPVKLLLIGYGAAFLFAGISLTNYNLPIFFTWPLIILFAFLSFLSVDRYCYALENKHVKKGIVFLILTTLWVTLAIYSFNIGLLLWPIIFIVLYKRKQFNKYLIIWCLIAAIDCYLYLSSGWHPGNRQLFLISLFDPIHSFLWFSRVVSLPFIPHAMVAASASTVLIAVIIILSTLFCLYKLWFKSNWTFVDAITFCFILFCSIALGMITIMRSSVVAEYVSIGTRFTTISLVLWLFLITGLITIIRIRAGQIFLTIVATVWLAFFFAPNDHKMIATGELNPYFIALASGVPLDQAFVENTKYINNELDIKNLVYNDRIQKQLQKGAYALLESKIINKSIKELPFKTNQISMPVHHEILLDFRNKNSPAIFVLLEMPKKMNYRDWSVVFVDEKNKIVGYSLPVSLLRHPTLWENIVADIPVKYVWEGAINSSLVSGNTIYTHILNKKNNEIIMGTSFKI